MKHYVVDVRIQQVEEATPPTVDRYKNVEPGTERKVTEVTHVIMTAPNLSQAIARTVSAIRIVDPVEEPKS